MRKIGLFAVAAAIIVFSAPALATPELPTAEPPGQVQTAVSLTPDVGVKRPARRAPAKVSSRQIGRYSTHQGHAGFLVLGVGF